MLARKSLLLFATHLTNSLLGFASTFVVARLMGPEILGTVGYLLGLIGLVAT
jgi:O-antigen/teichoic acid export membrane protein